MFMAQKVKNTWISEVLLDKQTDTVTYITYSGDKSKLHLSNPGGGHSGDNAVSAVASLLKNHYQRYHFRSIKG